MVLDLKRGRCTAFPGAIVFGGVTFILSQISPTKLCETLPRPATAPGNVTAKHAKYTKRNPRPTVERTENPQKATKKTKTQTVLRSLRFLLFKTSDHYRHCEPPNDPI